MTMRIALFSVAAMLLVAGCGGSTNVSSGSSAGEVAGIVPADVSVLVAFDTDRDSEQWQRADELLSKFPGRQRLLDALRDGLADEGVDLEDDVIPALGDETYLAFLDVEADGGNVVGLTQPRDKAKFEELLRESDEPLVTREVEEWTLVADSEALLDRFTSSSEHLEDADWFTAAQGRVEEEALVTLFVNGPAIYDGLRDAVPDECEVPEEYGKLEYAAGTLAAEDDGVRLRFAAEGEGVEDLLQGDSLLSQVPSGAFAYLGSPGFDTARFPLGAQLRCGLDSQSLPDVERELGVSFDDVLDLFAGGFAFYVRSATIVPEVTLLLAPEDDALAIETLDTLAEKVAGLGSLELERQRIGDTEARVLDVGPFSILYGAGDGKVVLTTAPGGFDALAGGGGGLEDDEAFKDARDAAGVGDGDEVFVYLDLRELVQLAEILAGLAEEDVPADVRANLEPLESFIVWGDLGDPNNVEFGAFLGIR
jgi:hypothetical protein